jgi:hypothetical protein
MNDRVYVLQQCGLRHLISHPRMVRRLGENRKALIKVPTMISSSASHYPVGHQRQGGPTRHGGTPQESTRSFSPSSGDLVPFRHWLEDVATAGSERTRQGRRAFCGALYSLTVLRFLNSETPSRRSLRLPGCAYHLGRPDPPLHRCGPRRSLPQHSLDRSCSCGGCSVPLCRRWVESPT